MSTAPLRVLVIGGGIGGLALAQALTSSDVHVEVYERNAEAADWLQGYRIHVNQFGSRALHRCLPPAQWETFVATSGRPGAGLTFQDHRLQELLFVDEEMMTGGATDPAGAHHAVSRIALRELLLAGLGDLVRFGRVFDRYEEHADGTVTAHFTDGTTATGDLLIGADGANSRVRKQLLPHADRVRTGIVGVAGKLPLTDETRAWLPASIHNGLSIVLPKPGSFLFSAVFDGGLHVDPENYVLWAFAAPRAAYPADMEALDGSALRTLVGEVAREWHPDLRRMIAESDPAALHLLEFKNSTPVDPWRTGRVTLLGDAIHNMTPVMGLGANTALRDAALLAHQLVAAHREETELLAAVAEYERRMLAYGFEAVNTSVGFAKRFTSRNPLGRLGMKAWLRVCAAVPRIKREAFTGVWTDDFPARRDMQVSRTG
jgi:2-polyprenyl-6-methoxyphenol hydroxylase-like FAD-dependent oxidoreductase